MIKTYEIFTSKYSRIVQDKDISKAILKHTSVEEASDIIAIIELERGKEFLWGKEDHPLSD